MEKHFVTDFLSLRLKQGAKLLLGLSGGPDSMALLYFLMASRKNLIFSLHIAHVDHRWREESKKEAKILEALATQLQLPFHLHTLKGINGSNVENRCREERLAFFTRLHQKYHFQALLLAHHRDDQAETVLKRVFEGAGLRALGGLRPTTYFGDLPVWRPLLSFKKTSLQSYLEQQNISYFEDRTNHDSVYLRARMRKKIFPEIERNFGKNIKNNCARLGSLCQEFSGYLEEKCQKLEKKLIKGPFGECLPLVFHPTELKFFLKRYDEKAHLSASALDLLIHLIQKGRGSRQIEASPITFYVNKHYLFILKNPFPNFVEEKERWRVVPCGTWLNFWKGEIAVVKGNVRMENFVNIRPYSRKKIKKWYNAHAVPSFFYERAPIFVQKEKIIGECLTGKCISSLRLTV